MTRNGRLELMASAEARAIMAVNGTNATLARSERWVKKIGNSVVQLSSC